MNIRSAAATVALGSTLIAATGHASSLGDCLSTDPVRFDGTVVDAAAATPELSTLVQAVLAAGLDDALATTEDITVYAPTNEAFEALPGDLLGSALGDQQLLTAVLTYHVTPGIQDPRRYVNAYRRDTLQGGSVFYHRKDKTPMVNGASLSCQGVRTDNGMVWIIDKVLLP